MKYVLDSSVALKWVLSEADSGRAIRLRDEYNNGLHELLAPDLFTPEVANSLVAAERHGRIKPGEAALLLSDVVRSAPRSTPPTRCSSVPWRSRWPPASRSTIVSMWLSPRRKAA